MSFRNVKMSVLENVVLVLICFAFTLHFSSCTSGPCSQLSSCQCVFPSGATVNLGNYPSKSNVINYSELSYTLQVIYSPCNDLIVLGPGGMQTACTSGVSVCILDNGTYYDGGHAAELKFVSTSQEQPVQAKFSKSNWNTIVEVNCSHNFGANDSMSITHYDVSTKTLTVGVQSNNVCVGFAASGGYGFFSTLFMIILLGFIIYFVGGALLLKFLRGAEGVEMIPHHGFWLNVPQHFKTWFSNVLQRLQPQERHQTYENI